MQDKYHNCHRLHMYTGATWDSGPRLAREILYGFYFLQPQRWRGGGIKKQKIKKKCYLVLEGSKRPSIKKDRKEKLSKQVKAHIDKKEYWSDKEWEKY